MCMWHGHSMGASPTLPLSWGAFPLSAIKIDVSFVCEGRRTLYFLACWQGHTLLRGLAICGKQRANSQATFPPRAIAIARARARASDWLQRSRGRREAASAQWRAEQFGVGQRGTKDEFDLAE